MKLLESPTLVQKEANSASPDVFLLAGLSGSTSWELVSKDARQLEGTRGIYVPLKLASGSRVVYGLGELKPT